MKIAFQLAYKNVMHAGLRTWLNAGALSFAFVIMLFFNGMVDGWQQQAKRSSIAWEYGQGQWQAKDYDSQDPFSIQNGYATIPANIQNGAVPILMRQASLYTEGKMFPIILKGIAPKQSLLALPTHELAIAHNTLPAIIGKQMALSANLHQGDQVMLQWRDKHGTFDAQKITIAEIFSTDVVTVDNQQIWIPIQDLWNMTGLYNQATLLVLPEATNPEDNNWIYKSQQSLMKELDDLIASKQYNSSIIYLLLLSIALLTIFDTQVFSIFRRQKEIGTYIALGMTRWQVVKIFTLEGSMYSLMAVLLGGLYGTPILVYVAHVGIGVPQTAKDMGTTIADRIYPVYSPMLISSAAILIVILATLVSFLPAKKIAHINPALAMKGKVQ